MKNHFVTKAFILLLVLSMVCTFAGCADKTNALKADTPSIPEAMQQPENIPWQAVSIETAPTAR